MTAATMTAADVDRVVHRVCGRKKRYLTVGHAIADQWAIRAKGDHVTQYRCPFSDGEPHWHLGHPPSIESMEQIALAIRLRAQRNYDQET